MKKAELFNLFKEYFDTELKYLVKDMVINEIKKQRSNTSSLYEDNVTKNVAKKSSTPKPKPPKPQPELFKNDNIIGQILNETLSENLIVEEKEDDGIEWPTFDRRLFIPKSQLAKENANKKYSDEELNEKSLMRSKYSNIVSYDENAFTSANSINYQSNPTVEEMIPEDMSHVPLPEELTAALTRDYTQLVKTFKKKG